MQTSIVPSFSSIKQATEAAQRWIDQELGLALPERRLGNVPQLGDVGTIPVLPMAVDQAAPVAQETPVAQED